MKRRGLVMAAAAATLLACGDAPPRGDALWPDLAVRDLAGRPLTLPAANGAARVINLWALWCPPCRRELPSLDRLARALAPDGIEVSGIAIAEDGFAVREYLAQHGIVMPSVLIPSLAAGLQPLRVESLPQTFLVASDGRVLERWIGEREWDQPDVRREIERALQRA